MASYDEADSAKLVPRRTSFVPDIRTRTSTSATGRTAAACSCTVEPPFA
ncbi:hypothetical protein OVA02_06795 [Frigoribacterium sp. SL97]|nr:hypothetical protein [Frigoribacterium sp. SL97]WAC52945.1 hypothetical protein OVA02_06795 [Frigoribacterium sp. SL97]